MSLPTNFFIGRGGAAGGLYDFPKNTVFQFRGSASAAVRYGLDYSQSLAVYDTNTYPWMLDNTFYNVITNGYQLWTVPSDGVYEISARGAVGGTFTRNGVGYSKGGLARGRFQLTEGQKITICCGHKGRGQAQASGGGGTFVVADEGDYTNAQTSQILVIAGGGGGGFSSDNRGDGGRFGADGGRGHGSEYGSGGTNGQGGDGGRLTDGGGGFLSNGQQTTTSDSAGNHGYYGLGYRQGLTGGDGNPAGDNHACSGSTLYQNEGGFGGGGGMSYAANGAGGGYSGGGGSDGCSQSDEAGGGGGSIVNTSHAGYVAGTETLLPGFNNSFGHVVVTRL